MHITIKNRKTGKTVYAHFDTGCSCAPGYRERVYFAAFIAEGFASYSDNQVLSATYDPNRDTITWGDHFQCKIGLEATASHMKLDNLGFDYYNSRA